MSVERWAAALVSLRVACYQAAPRAHREVWGGARAARFTPGRCGEERGWRATLSGSREPLKKKAHIFGSRGCIKTPGVASCIELDGGGDGTIADVIGRLFCSEGWGVYIPHLGAYIPKLGIHTPQLSTSFFCLYIAPGLRLSLLCGRAGGS